MKNKKILIYLIIPFFLFPKNVSAKDLFPELEILKINEKINQDLIIKGTELKDDNQDTTFLEYKSSFYSHPHFIEIKPSREIVYIELAIPETHLEVYQTILLNLGDPETKEEKTPSNILLAYPSKGIGFIISERNQNFLIQIKFPKKSIKELKENEAKNFIPISQKDAFPTGILSPIPKETTIPKDLIYENEKEEKREQTKLYTIYLSSSFLLLSGILISLYLKKKPK